MPVTTRAQYRARIPECTRIFKETIENPCIVHLIINHLDEHDMISMKQVSKDSRFNDVIDHKLKKVRSDKNKLKTVILNVKQYLTKVEDTDGCKSKIIILNKMFEFLCNNKWFLRDNPPFNKAVHRKLFELIVQYPPFQEDAIEYLKTLFDLKPPMDYYNSKLGVAQYGMFDIENNFVILEKKI